MKVIVVSLEHPPLNLEQLLFQLAGLPAVRGNEPNLKTGGVELTPVALVDRELLADTDGVLALACDFLSRALPHPIGGKTRPLCDLVGTEIHITVLININRGLILVDAALHPVDQFEVGLRGIIFLRMRENRVDLAFILQLLQLVQFRAEFHSERIPARFRRLAARLGIVACLGKPSLRQHRRYHLQCCKLVARPERPIKNLSIRLADILADGPEGVLSEISDRKVVFRAEELPKTRSQLFNHLPVIWLRIGQRLGKELVILEFALGLVVVIGLGLRELQALGYLEIVREAVAVIRLGNLGVEFGDTAVLDIEGQRARNFKARSLPVFFALGIFRVQFLVHLLGIGKS